jgi:PKD repeat protein
MLDIVSYSWDFGDTNSYTETASSHPDGAFDGVTTHTYTNDGDYTVTLTVTDEDSNTDTDTTIIHVLNVAPSIAAIPDTSIDEGQTYSYTSGTFTDPGADTWTATVDYDDGDGVEILPLSGKTFSLSHTYAVDGVYDVLITITDDDESSTEEIEIVVGNVAPDIYSSSFVYTISQGTMSQTIPAIETATTGSAFYNYYSASSHTGYEKAYESKLMLHRDITTDEISLIITHNIDRSTSGIETGIGAVFFDIAGVPTGAYVSQSDDPNHGWSSCPLGASTRTSAPYQELDLSYAREGEWYYGDNTDGGSISGLPTTSSWSITITPEGFHRITKWVYHYATGTQINLDMNEPVTISYSAQTEPTTVVTDEGTPITLGAFARDWGTDDEPLDYEFAWDDPDNVGATSTGTTLWDTLFTGTHTYPDDGTNNPLLTVTDSDLATDTLTYTVIVNNVAPTVDAGADLIVNEGTSLPFSGTFTDPGTLDTHKATWSWGDSTPDTVIDPETSPSDPSHTYADDTGGPFTVTLSVEDDDLGSDSDTLTVTVNNVAPTLSLLTGPSTPTPVGTEITIGGTFTDPGTLDTHEATINWGDGPAEGPVAVTSPISLKHTYSTPGVYTVELTVEDDDGGSDVKYYMYVVVYDPSGGFVTGGGQFQSPEGAYVPDETLTGKATFGFVSKYKKGQTVPTGNTEFQFKAGSLNFHSKDYQWLIIAGASAKFKGTGTINGAGNYGFMITAVDAKLTPSTTVDLFRIVIWDKDNSDAVVYDNQLGADENADPTMAISGGNIVVHKPK